MHFNDDGFGAMTRKLERLAKLNEQDRDALKNLPLARKRVAAGQHLLREGEESTTCYMLLSGYACRYKTTRTGSRQIVSFHMAGDIVDLQHLLLSRADHSIQAISDLTFAATPAAELKKVAQTHPTIAEALWRDTLIDASVFREWVLNVGRRDAKQRIAHMLCEFAARRETAGLGRPTSFELPMTQEDIADATGLTNVHVNRMLAQLAAEGLIARDKRQVEIADWDRMRRAADFDAAYLHAQAA
ncbi:Crp/Fnr family transcriptional regulator [Sphingomonas sp.]|jgi:CRP-like cAMP-binding protein|uniref:Crp/Fnr family transcriptional regulator n=1 Tax=Sphingomonas sp. TaxID=28214 RepID=UPI002D8062C4|nr:Crp/Fnr family transcriptional regulator [Sphingomonas sp.]HEU0045583.1 Crp/Fnr family transcriptional regulator [Sphingomonas sp.]